MILAMRVLLVGLISLVFLVASFGRHLRQSALTLGSIYDNVLIHPQQHPLPWHNLCGHNAKPKTAKLQQK